MSRGSPPARRQGWTSIAAGNRERPGENNGERKEWASVTDAPASSRSLAPASSRSLRRYEPESLTPVWMGLVLLLAAVLGILLLLVGAWSPFVDAGSGGVPVGSPPSIRFIDQATMWVGQSLAGTAAWASVAALTAFTVVVLCRRHQRQPTPYSFRLAGVVVAGFLAAVELAGPVTMAIGFVQLATDPTAARDLTDQLRYLGPPFVLCLVLTLLSFLLAWVLWHARPALQADPSDRQPSVTADITAAIDRPDIYRRPR